MKQMTFCFLLALAGFKSNGQEPTPFSDFAEATLVAGSHRGTFSIAYFHNWKLGKKDRISVGLGGRATTFFGSELYYITAPAILTSGSRGPLVLFRENINENIDSLLIGSPRVNAVNAAINIQYRISRRTIAGFNIDAIGFSFGGKKDTRYINGDEGANTRAAPTAFNVLLVSDNDRGSLNSEFYGKYFLSEKIALKGAAQFLFTEYTTDTDVQQLPRPNDRFRNKALMFAIGISYRLR
jgi:hypothetical protein